MANKIIKVIGNELYHSGILGQKWGLRRYQNEDGTYTELGKIRRRKGSDDYERARELKKKGVKNLSNKELQDYNNRANLERQFKQNSGVGANFVNKYKNVVIASAAGLTGAATIAKGKDIVNALKDAATTLNELSKYQIDF